MTKSVLSGYPDDMDANRELNAKDLYGLYGDYVAAH